MAEYKQLQSNTGNWEEEMKELLEKGQANRLVRCIHVKSREMLEGNGMGSQEILTYSRCMRSTGCSWILSCCIHMDFFVSFFEFSSRN